MRLCINDQVSITRDSQCIDPMVCICIASEQTMQEWWSGHLCWRSSQSQRSRQGLIGICQDGTCFAAFPNIQQLGIENPSEINNCYFHNLNMFYKTSVFVSTKTDFKIVLIVDFLLNCQCTEETWMKEAGLLEINFTRHSVFSFWTVWQFFSFVCCFFYGR